jgi:hypothetical protein
MTEEPSTPTTESSEPVAQLPDYVTDPNAVFKDPGVEWRYGAAPDYSKTRAVYEQSEFSMIVLRSRVC